MSFDLTLQFLKADVGNAGYHFEDVYTHFLKPVFWFTILCVLIRNNRKHTFIQNTQCNSFSILREVTKNIGVKKVFLSNK